MKAFLLLGAFGFLLSIWMHSILYGTLLLIFLGIYFIIRFKRIGIVLLWLAASLLLQVYTVPRPVEPTSGLYTIIEIKPNYCIAQKEKSRIVLYGVKEPSFYDQYEVKKIERVHSIKNIGLFNFEDSLQKRNIYYCANVGPKSYRSSQSSVRASLFSYFKGHPNASYYMANLYGIYEEDLDSSIVRLGLPILFVSNLLRMFFRKFFSKRKSDLIVFCFLLGYGWLFLFTPSLVRILIFLLAGICFKTWEERLACSIYCFVFCMPGYALDFIFIYPLLLRVIRYFCSDIIRRVLLNKLSLFICMLIYFHEVDWIHFLCFSFFRTIHSYLFLLSFPCLLFPNLFAWVYSMYTSCMACMPEYVTVYLANFIFLCLSGVLFYRIYKEKRVFLLGTILGIFFFFGHKLDPFFHVYMLDIGQGDCTVIVEPFQKSVVMIDCGQNLYRDNVEAFVLPFLESRHISCIDALIVTHEDFDHSGGVEPLCEKIEVRSILSSRSDTVPVSYPFYSLIEKREAKDENDQSIISYFSYDNFKYLWMGDAGIAVEQELMNQYPDLEVDVCNPSIAI